MSDAVNHPNHYKSNPSGIECIDVVEHMNFNRGNAMKYIWRAGSKGDELEDLKKAAWYIQREIERLQVGRLNDEELSVEEMIAEMKSFSLDEYPLGAKKNSFTESKQAQVARDLSDDWALNSGREGTS